MDQARGFDELDLVLRNAQLVNVFSGEIHTTEIGVHQGRFVGIGTFAKAKTEIDLNGKYVVPGLIDGHVHVESSHLCPEEFCSLLLAHGVTTAVLDPHEIANVLGVKGIRYILESVSDLPFNAFIALPSCVPATELETSGAQLEAEDLRELLSHPKVIGLGEVMDFVGVLEASPGMVKKLELPVKFRDGHAPGINAQDLNAYFLAGIHTDHECSSVDEARERLRRGFYVMLREGSAAKNLLDLLPVVNDANAGQCLFVTDDRQPADLQQEGSIDHLVRLAIKAGLSPVRAIQMATINAARAIGLAEMGAVAPGYQADFVVLNDLERFEIEEVYWQGNLQSTRGRRPKFACKPTRGLQESVRLGDWSAEKLKVTVPAQPQAEMRQRVRVIGMHCHSLVTTALIRELPVKDGLVQADLQQGIAKIAVLERHHGSGRVGVGFVEGLGLKKGAIASTVAHDSHNMIVVGTSDEEMDLAVRTCREMGGGLCLIEGANVLGRLPLPLAGLMSDQPPEEVAQILTKLHEKAHSLGISPNVDPFMSLAFLSLPVIPELKLTDLGLVDVLQFRLIELLAPWRSGGLWEMTDLAQVITFIGAGGKTTCLQRLTQEISRAGPRAVATTTTKVYPELSMKSWQGTDFQASFGEEFPLFWYTGYEAKSGKWLGPSVNAVDTAINNSRAAGCHPDQRLHWVIEGDGAREHRLKCWASHEPQIPLNTQWAVLVLDGRLWGQYLEAADVHRPEICPDLLGQRWDANHAWRYFFRSPVFKLKYKHISWVILFNQRETRILPNAPLQELYEAFQQFDLQIDEECVKPVHLRLAAGNAREGKLQWFDLW